MRGCFVAAILSHSHVFLSCVWVVCLARCALGKVLVRLSRLLGMFKRVVLEGLECKLTWRLM